MTVPQELKAEEQARPAIGPLEEAPPEGELKMGLGQQQAPPEMAERASETQAAPPEVTRRSGWQSEQTFAQARLAARRDQDAENGTDHFAQLE
jgi:hypothetical protein